MQLALVLLPLTPALPPTNVVNACMPWKKTWPMCTSGPALPAKALGVMLPLKDMPSR